MYTITCIDKYGDGWNGGYITFADSMVETDRFCDSDKFDSDIMEMYISVNEKTIQNLGKTVIFIFY